MYRNNFLKTVLLITVFLLSFVLVACESKETSEESKNHDHSHSAAESGEAIDAHTLGHVFHAMGVPREVQSKLVKDVKVMYFDVNNGTLSKVDSMTNAKIAVYVCGNAYVGEAPISISGSKVNDSYVFVGLGSGFKKIMDMNFHGVKNDPAREFIKAFKGIDIIDGKLNVTVDKNDEDTKTILSTINFIIGSVEKAAMLMN
ncbi:lipoprotein P22 [Candidatus Borreliella tachyglossi]|uniref:lipoprotein P22 n=1 Tax=Candidatus Borreliella tachyglossi TaxID=1964448 RepID=UPI00404343D5